MNAIGTGIRHLFDVGVDDIGFAAAVVGWIALARPLSVAVLPSTPWAAVTLFLGLAAILLGGVARRSREG